jgi:hypothetical protein
MTDKSMKPRLRESSDFSRVMQLVSSGLGCDIRSLGVPPRSFQGHRKRQLPEVNPPAPFMVLPLPQL